MSGQRNDIAQEFDIFVGEAHLHPSFVSSRLLRSSAGINADRGRAERLPDVANGTSEPFAVRQKQYNRGDPPCHAEHGQQRLTQVVTHGAIRLNEDVVFHLFPSQRLDWFEQSCFACRIESRNNAGKCQRADGQHGGRGNQSGSIETLWLRQQR